MKYIVLSLLFCIGIFGNQIYSLKKDNDVLNNKIKEYENMKISVSYESNPCSPKISLSTYSLLIEMGMEKWMKLCDQEINKN